MPLRLELASLSTCLESAPHSERVLEGGAGAACEGEGRQKVSRLRFALISRSLFDVSRPLLLVIVGLFCDVKIGTC